MPLKDDRFGRQSGGLSDPAYDALAITPADADLSKAVRGLYVGGAGNVAIVTPAGTTVTFTAVPAGTILPVRADRVNTTGTTATNIIGLI